MIKNDYILNQIEMLIKVGANILFRNQDQEDRIMVFRPEASGLGRDLAQTLIAMVDEGKINQAENRLFEILEEQGGQVPLQGAIYFYGYLLGLGPEVLKAGAFSVGEIKEGFEEVCRLYEIADILF